MEENSQKIQELQILEQNLQNLMVQKQSINMELSEIVNAIQEVNNSNGDVYKITGQIMIKANKESTIKDLEEKKKVFEIRNESIEKQEKLLLSKADEIKEEFKKPSSKKEFMEIFQLKEHTNIYTRSFARNKGLEFAKNTQIFILEVSQETRVKDL